MKQQNPSQYQAVRYLYLLPLLVSYLFAFYLDLLWEMPLYQHAWTQADKYAHVLCFLKNGFDFLHPCTFSLTGSTGTTAVDFPVHEYAVALLMNVLGTETPVVLRLYTFLLGLLGYFGLFALVQRLSGSFWAAFFSVWFVFLLPLLAYYQVCFLPSSTAWSGLWPGLYFLLVYVEKKQLKTLGWALFFLGLSAMVRMPYLMYLVCATMVLILDAVQSKKWDFRVALMVVTAFLTVFSWAFYKTYLEKEYGTIYLSQLRPPSSFAEAYHLARDIIKKWASHFAGWPHLVAFGVAFLWSFRRVFANARREKYRLMYLFAVLSFFAAMAYFFAMLLQFVDHDYYFIDSFYPSFALFFALCLCSFFEKKQGLHLKIAFLTALALFASFYGKNVIGQKTDSVLSARSLAEWKDYENAESFLDSLGIPQKAKMLCLDANSVNFPLLLMDRNGNTVLSTKQNALRFALDSMDYDLVTVQDRHLYSDVLLGWPQLQNHLLRKGGNGLISIFEYRNEWINQSPLSLLGQQELSVLLRADAVENDEEFPLGVDLKEIPRKTGVLFGVHLGIKGKEDNMVGTVLLVGSAAPSNDVTWYDQQERQIERGSQWIWANFTNSNLAQMPNSKCYIWNPNHLNLSIDSMAIYSY